MKPSNRRQFITDTTKAGISTLIAAPTIGALLSASAGAESNNKVIGNTGYKQEPLPYAFSALEPFIDTMTMEIHYGKHAAAYCKNLNEAMVAEKADAAKPLEDILSNISSYSIKMRNNGGGHYNHEMFWKCLGPANAGTTAGNNFLKAVTENFGSIDEMKTKFSEAGKTRFGSGWAWLIINKNKKLSVCSTPNQDNPLMELTGMTEETKGYPLLALDVWEHAYYLKYQNKRADYIENFWKIVNWDYVTKRFESA
jgi:Fe-Mn family superoxide dismutase